MNKPSLIMGVLNVTPDSFSDGGLYATPETALKHVEQMVLAGADIIDVGGESARPGAESVPVQVEIDRVVPVIAAIHSRLPVRISIDTRKYEVAVEAVRNGASILNDISGGTDFRMAKLAASYSLTVLLMHMQGTPQMMQESPDYPRGVVTEVAEFLAERVRCFDEVGVLKEKIWVDPGIGFGKTLAHNLELLRHLVRFKNIGDRLAIGTSRKSFLSQIETENSNRLPLPVDQRLPGTLASSLWAYTQGASVFRVHDVEQMKRALRTWERIASDR